MADETTTDESDKEFEAGFEGTGAPSHKETQASQQPPAEGKTDEKPDDKAQAASGDKKDDKPSNPPPETVHLTKADYDRLMASATKTDQHETQLSKAFGSIGAMQQIVQKLKEATPQGVQVELPDDVVSEMEKDFPELAGHFRASLKKALTGIKGTAGGAKEASVLDKDAVQNVAREMAVKLEREALEDAHPDWQNIVGSVDSQGRHDPENQFRKWLAKQPESYQQKVNATNSSAVIGRAIDRYRADEAKAATQPSTPKEDPKAAGRKSRIQNAVQPRGDGGQPPPTKTPDDEFEAGFRDG